MIFLNKFLLNEIIKDQNFAKFTGTRKRRIQE